MIFRKQSDAAPRYSLDDLRHDIGAAIAKARAAVANNAMVARIVSFSSMVILLTNP
jgi:hypothetical protein